MKAQETGRLWAALSLAGALALQGCVPHIRTTKEQKFFHVPTVDRPWQQLTNGVDLYFWYQCYGSDDLVKPDCSSMNIDAIRRDGQRVPSVTARQPLARRTFTTAPTIAPLLGAYGKTHHRIVGLATDRHHDILILRHAKDTTNPHNEKWEVEAVDIWHNAHCLQQPTPMLVVMDERFLWIFAKPDSSCLTPLNDLYAPNDWLKFVGPGADSELLRSPMQVFFLDRENREAADFSAPRAVTRNAGALRNVPRAVIAFEDVKLPQEQVFTLELARFDNPIPANPVPNMKCKYSETRFFMTIFEDTPNPLLKGCTPFVNEVR